MERRNSSTLERPEVGGIQDRPTGHRHGLIGEMFDDDAHGQVVWVVDGYGLSVSVNHGHLVVRDGIGRHRRERRIAKVANKLRRLVVIGHSGTITLEALRWLDRVAVTFLHVDTDGRVLTTSAHPSLNDARLRRIQALTAHTEVGLKLVASLLNAKLTGQAAVAAAHLDAPTTAERIDTLRQGLSGVSTVDEARDLEAAAAHAYFSAWPGRVALSWAKRDLARIPEHWTRYDARRSPLSTGSATRAADPVNAILNYLYALAEAECHQACLAVGLDPGLGFLHADTKGRNSLALDLIEVIRPQVDAYTIAIADGHVFRRADFTETDDGHCRILAPLTHRLADTLPTWRDAVAPWAETIAHALADASPHPIRKATPLTSNVRRRIAAETSAGRRKANRRNPTPNQAKANRRPRLDAGCENCGTPLHTRQRQYCPDCWPARRLAAALAGSAAARATLDNDPARQRKRQAIKHGKATAQADRAHQLGWTLDNWHNDIAPLVSTLTLKTIVGVTGYSINHASRIRRGTHVPHPKHWQALADIVKQVN